MLIKKLWLHQQNPKWNLKDYSSYIWKHVQMFPNNNIVLVALVTNWRKYVLGFNTIRVVLISLTLNANNILFSLFTG